MKKILLIGDSIRMGYQAKVIEILTDKAEVLTPSENCRFSSYTLFSLSTWAPDSDYDVIQWNNGQWDTCYMPDGKIHTPLPLYLELQKRIASILRPKGRRLLFATTTPVRPDQFTSATRNPRKNEDIEVFNRRAAEELSALGVEIVDLYGPLARDIPAFIGEDKVHLTPAGADACASIVAAALMK